MLGPSATATYSRGFLSLEPGDALLLYTDGMVEATDPKEREFGIERLKRAFLALRERPADEIVRALTARSASTSAPGLPRTTRRSSWSSASRTSRRRRFRAPRRLPARPDSARVHQSDDRLNSIQMSHDRRPAVPVRSRSLPRARPLGTKEG